MRKDGDKFSNLLTCSDLHYSYQWLRQNLPTLNGEDTCTERQLGVSLVRSRLGESPEESYCCNYGFGKSAGIVIGRRKSCLVITASVATSLMIRQ